MRAEQLHVFTARFNPLRWQLPDRVFRDWCQHILDSGAVLHIGEVQYGERPYTCNHLPHVHHVGFRADSWSWSKENVLNQMIARAPEAEYICWSDADVFQRKSGWATETVEALQHYRVVQPWTKALDLGPNDELLQVHHSFAALYMDGKPVVPTGGKFWKFDGGAYDYAHTGYQWACTRAFLDWAGGLFELGGMGSGDHHMALGLVGAVDRSWPGGTTASYQGHLRRWQDRAQRFVNGRIGAVPGIIEHRWHGRKTDRNYLGRWDMFLKHSFDPDTDLKRNANGILEWAGNKPELEREWDRYLRSRNEDANTIT
jgi:hypothetical protein